MKLILDKIAQRAAEAPLKTALICDGKPARTLNNRELLLAVANAEANLISAKVRCLGLYMDNCADWVVYDLAAAKLGICVVPIPLFFSPTQISHLIEVADIDFVLLKDTKLEQVLSNEKKTTNKIEINNSPCVLIGISNGSKPEKYNNNVAKITFTSGSTGEPKGVCLSYENIEAVCLSLEHALLENSVASQVRHLCVMPLATLLENIAGVYLPLLRGGVVITQPLNKLGFESNSEFDASRLVQQLQRLKVASTILFPQILENLVKQPINELAQITEHLQFVAVGGGVVSPQILQHANQLGLPVFQGYGLSECGSVVSLNLPQNNRVGSVGKVLRHVDISVNNDGELIIHGQSMLGYLGHAGENTQEIATGDLGYIDKDGYVFVTGRKKNILVSSFGRNISPEWIESILTAQPEIKQAVVIGDGKSQLSTILVLNESVGSDVSHIIARVNAHLPDYARLGSYCLSPTDFNANNGLLTHNGRPKRNEILSRFVEKTFIKLSPCHAA